MRKKGQRDLSPFLLLPLSFLKRIPNPASKKWIGKETGAFEKERKRRFQWRIITLFAWKYGQYEILSLPKEKRKGILHLEVREWHDMNAEIFLKKRQFLFAMKKIFAVQTFFCWFLLFFLSLPFLFRFSNEKHQIGGGEKKNESSQRTKQ